MLRTGGIFRILRDSLGMRGVIKKRGSTPEHPGAPRSSPDGPGVPRSSPEFPGVPRSAPECPGVPRSAPECPGVPRITRDYNGSSWIAQDSPGVPGLHGIVMDFQGLFGFPRFPIVPRKTLERIGIARRTPGTRRNNTTSMRMVEVASAQNCGRMILPIPQLGWWLISTAGAAAVTPEI